MVNDNRDLPIEMEFTVSVENIKLHLLITRDTERSANSDTTSPPSSLHDHVSTEIFASVKGMTEISCEGSRLLLEEGDMAIVPPWVRHYMLPRGTASDTAVVSFLCERRAVGGAADLYSVMKPFLTGDSIAVFRAVPKLCERVERISDTVGTGHEVTPALEAVMLLLDAAAIGGCKTEGNRGESVEQYDIKRMMKLDNIIGRLFMQDLKMADVAKQLYISPRQLDRIVRRRYGKSLRRVITEKRLKESERLLLTTDMTAERVGITVGFSSSASFYRGFCTAYGVTPAEYRKINRK